MRPLAIGVATALVMGTVIGGLTLIEQRAEQNVRSIPVPVRQDLYERGLAELRGICVQPIASTGVLHLHCLEEARFVARFPECTADCQAIVSHVLPPPARK